MSNSVNSSHHSSIAGGEVSKNVNRTDDDDDDMADKKKGGSSSESAISSFKLILLVLMVLQNSSTVLVGRYTRTSVAKSELYVVNHLILVTELGKVSLDESFDAAVAVLFGTVNTFVHINSPIDHAYIQ